MSRIKAKVIKRRLKKKVRAMPKTKEGKAAAKYIQQALKEINKLEREMMGDPNLEETKDALLDAAAGTLKL